MARRNGDLSARGAQELLYERLESLAGAAVERPRRGSAVEELLSRPSTAEAEESAQPNETILIRRTFGLTPEDLVALDFFLKRRRRIDPEATESEAVGDALQLAYRCARQPEQMSLAARAVEQPVASAEPAEPAEPLPPARADRKLPIPEKPLTDLISALSAGLNGRREPDQAHPPSLHLPPDTTDLSVPRALRRRLTAVEGADTTGS